MIAAIAAAQMAGGSAVVKMKPYACERTASTRFAVPAMYPPRHPNAKRALDHVNSVHDTLLGSHTCTARSVHADRMNLVAIGHGAIAFGEIANAFDRGQVAVHGIETFKHHQLRALRSRRRK